MTEEEKIFAGQLFCPGDPDLKAIKLRAHTLSAAFSRLGEEESEKRAAILKDLIGNLGNNCFMQGPIFFHYGTHTTIGDNLFANYNLTVQDDAKVTIGRNNNFGPNVSIVTPVHPMIASERLAVLSPEGDVKRVCYAKPVTIGNDVWLCANVVICGGATIGDGCVIGAGSVVTGDIPPHSFAAGVPCRVIHPITEKDSIVNMPQVAAGYRPLPKEDE